MQVLEKYLGMYGPICVHARKRNITNDKKNMKEIDMFWMEDLGIKKLFLFLFSFCGTGG